MQELVKKLKESLIDNLTKNEQLLDKPYLIKNGKYWTRKEISEEIKNETEFGIKLMSDMIILAIDITNRNINK